MQREIRKLRTWLGRVIRDVQRKGGEIIGALQQKIEIAQRLHAQRRDAKNKLYALHAPEAECRILERAKGIEPSS
jgi:transposase, IS5 family